MEITHGDNRAGDQAKKKIEIYRSCMDCRMNPRILDRIEKGKIRENTLIIRDAGLNGTAHFKTLKRLGEEYDVDVVIDNPHYGCGAWKKVFSLLHGGVKTPGDERLFDGLGMQYADLRFDSSDGLAAYNESKQMTLARGIFGGDVTIITKMIEFHEDPPHHRHMLIISNPVWAYDYAGMFEAVGEKPINCYCMHKLDADKAPSLELAVMTLKIQDLAFVALPGEDISEVRARADATMGMLADYGYTDLTMRTVRM